MIGDSPSTTKTDGTNETAAPKGRGVLSWLPRAAALNLPYLLALFAMELLHPFLQTLVVGAIIFLAPGLAWADRAKGDGFVVLFRAILISLLAALVAWLVLLPFPGLTNRIAFILILALVTNVGLWMGTRRAWFAASPFRSTLAAAIVCVGALFYVQTYLGAAHYVPALEDQDMETQGTAYGLIHEASPTMVTNRDTRYFFAHPFLLHFWIGESALISDDLDRLRYHHDTARTVVDAPAELYAQWERNFEQFKRDPVLMPTRAPNLFLSVFTIIAMGFLVFRLTGSTLASAGAGLLYMTLPEVYVRSSYGGYMAVTNFLLVAGAYFYLDAAGLLPQRAGEAQRPNPARRRGFLAAFLGGWADQKAVLLPMAAPIHAGLRILADGALSLKQGFPAMIARVWTRPDFFAAFVVGLGFVVGWSLFALYGLAIAPDDFITDHIKGHITWRINKPVEALQGAANEWYPSLAALWLEFARHTGWLVTAVFVAAAAWAAPRFRNAEGFLLVWALIGAVGFSLVDWRMTKHLAHIVPALVMLTAIFWSSLQGRWRMALSAVLAAAILWNIWRVGLQMRDFEYIQPMPIW